MAKRYTAVELEAMSAAERFDDLPCAFVPV
jgi:hypothetical protein